MKDWFKKISKKISGKGAKSEQDKYKKNNNDDQSLQTKTVQTVSIKEQVKENNYEKKNIESDNTGVINFKEEKFNQDKINSKTLSEIKSNNTEENSQKINVTKSNWLNRLGDNFKKTSANIRRAIFKKKMTTKDLEYLEEAFLLSDLGVLFTEKLINEIKNKKMENVDIKAEIVRYLENQFKAVDHNFLFKKNSLPQIVLFFGVNGSGKTTTLAKLANKAKEKDLSVKIIAADTFRAAAVEQLVEWGKRLDLNVFTGVHNEDPSSVVFKGHKQAIKDNTDVLLIDTAGRLHNKKELMEELKKILRTIQKNDPNAPHNKILVLDSTIGQNTYSQLEAFNSSIGITGVIMTKLDSSAKGGSLIGISKQHNTPVHFLGVGEKIDDLVDFNAKDFINALIGDNFGEKNEGLH